MPFSNFCYNNYSNSSALEFGKSAYGKVKIKINMMQDAACIVSKRWAKRPGRLWLQGAASPAIRAFLF